VAVPASSVTPAAAGFFPARCSLLLSPASLCSRTQASATQACSSACRSTPAPGRGSRRYLHLLSESRKTHRSCVGVADAHRASDPRRAHLRRKSQRQWDLEGPDPRSRGKNGKGLDKRPSVRRGARRLSNVNSPIYVLIGSEAAHACGEPCDSPSDRPCIEAHTRSHAAFAHSRASADAVDGGDAFTEPLSAPRKTHLMLDAQPMLLRG
jgi:hypothetical protein